MSITKDMREAMRPIPSPAPAELHKANAGIPAAVSVLSSTPVKEGGKKHDAGKPDLTLVPLALEEACARALGFGAGKYGRNNFKGGIKYTRVLAACLRHLRAWNERRDNDEESGLSHLDHAVACLAMLAHYESAPDLKARFDDRDLKHK
jgi:hypothetical protein